MYSLASLMLIGCEEADARDIKFFLVFVFQEYRNLAICYLNDAHFLALDWYNFNTHILVKFFAEILIDNLG